jgi:pimeloyl-ACP methyl ester carboxylesterase
MLHSATSSGPEDFAAQLPRFRKAFRCYLPDARGHGGSAWDVGRGFTAAMLVEDVIGLADALHLETFHLLGFSMGAMTALGVAIAAPDRVRTLVTVGITPEREPRTSVARRLMDPDRIEHDEPERAARLAARHDRGQGSGAWRRLLPAIAADVASQPLLTPRQLHEIEAPTLVVAGDRDPFCPVDHAVGLARQLRHARLLIAPGCGHEVPAAAPNLFNAACEGFYRATESIAETRARQEDT